jgi:hypothetical protein
MQWPELIYSQQGRKLVTTQPHLHDHLQRHLICGVLQLQDL